MTEVEKYEKYIEELEARPLSCWLNTFHRESTLQSCYAILEMKKTKMNYEEEYARHKRLHEVANKMEEDRRKNKT